MFLTFTLHVKPGRKLASQSNSCRTYKMSQGSVTHPPQGGQGEEVRVCKSLALYLLYENLQYIVLISESIKQTPKTKIKEELTNRRLKGE